MRLPRKQRRTLQQLELSGEPWSWEPHTGPIAYEIAVSYALSSDRENALVWLKKALALGLRSRTWLRDDEQLASLRSDPSFLSLTMSADVLSMDRIEGWRHDLAFLAAELKRRHYQPFRRISREDFDAAVVPTA